MNLTRLLSPYNLCSYPINSLRNLAVRNAETELIMVVDIDFIPSDGFHQFLSTRHDDLVHRALSVSIPLPLILALPAPSSLAQLSPELPCLLASPAISSAGRFHGETSRMHDRVMSIH